MLHKDTEEACVALHQPGLTVFAEVEQSNMWTNSMAENLRPVNA